MKNNEKLKVKDHNKKFKQSGFSTLEILMAMFVLVLALTGVVTVSFGTQSMIIDSQTNAEALNVAQGLLEKAQADARRDFNLVNPVGQTTDGQGFKSWTEVEQTDFFTKLVTARVEFPEDSGRIGKTELSALVTDFNNAIGGDTCSSILLDSSGAPNKNAWKNPQIKNSQKDFSSLAGVSGDYAISDVDAYRGRLYVTVGKSPSKNDPTFFIFDISNPFLPSLLGRVDNAADTAQGLNAVAVAEDPISNKIYAYVANNDYSNQLQIIDVTDPESLEADQITNFNLDNVSGTQGKGNSIAYKDGYIYLGLQATGGKGPEFNILDVHLDKSHPVQITGRSYYAVGNAVNTILVRGKYAYLATPNARELLVLDIHDPSCVVTNPQASGAVCETSGTPAWGFDALGSSGGKSLYLLGSVLYFGKVINNTEFYILDGSNAATNTMPMFGSRSDINLSVDGISVREDIAFLLLKTGFKALDVDNYSDIRDWGFLDLSPYAGSGDLFEPSLDCEGNNFFVGSNTGGHGYLLVIAP